jgi:hypothetical protein
MIYAYASTRKRERGKPVERGKHFEEISVEVEQSKSNPVWWWWWWG